MKKTLLTLAAAMLCAIAAAQGPVEKDLNSSIENSDSDIAELRPLDERIDSFMQRWSIRGATLAITRNDSLVYAKGYGWADKERRERMRPGHTMRLASVSKLITAIGIMVLQEDGRLNLQSPVFGPFGLLDGYDDLITDDNYYAITVEHLLRHQAGFTTQYGDPMFSTRKVMRQFGLSKPPTMDEMIRCQVTLPLDAEPGTVNEYSNFGYLLLSAIIEKVSGMSYADFIQERVFQKAGCTGFHIAGNYLSDRVDGEVKYYPPDDSEPISDFSGSGKMVPRCYGGNDVTGSSGAGAWAGSAVELAKLIASIDAILGQPDILMPFTIMQMGRYIDEETMALGWLVSTPEGELTRTGSFAGTNALVKLYPDGECWILLTNTSTWKGTRLARETQPLLSTCRRDYGNLLPKRDLF